MKKAFTLIEVLISVFLILIIKGLNTPKLQQEKMKSGISLPLAREFIILLLMELQEVEVTN